MEQNRSTEINFSHPEHLEETKYQILTVNNYDEVMGKEARLHSPWKTDEAMRADYAGRTIELISKIIDGNYDTIIFTDKSARPVSWLVKEIWPLVTNDDIPDIKFINIDANLLLNKPAGLVERPSQEDISNYKPSEEQKDQIRNIFKVPSKNESYLDNKNILIIEDVLVTGATGLMGEKLVKEAIPSSDVSHAFWMKGITEIKDNIRQVSQLPVWYRKQIEAGRGIGDAKLGELISQPYITDEQSGEKISTSKDPLSTQLRKEIKQLAADIKKRQQSVWPRSEKLCFATTGDGKINYSKPRFKIFAPTDTYEDKLRS